MGRNNIDIDEALVQRVMVRFGLTSKREAVDYALRHVIGQTMTREQAAAMLGAIPDFTIPSDAAARSAAVPPRHL
jgi:Arc/MetJ family transcription regulator